MILLTGATGMVGYHVLQILLQKNEKVRVLVRDPLKFKMEETRYLKIMQGDVTDYNSLLNALDDIDTIVHVAAVMTFWKKRHEEMENVNVEGTKNLVDASLVKGTVKKFIYISALAGVGTPLDEGRVNEDSEFDTGSFTTCYSETKHRAEEIVLHGASNGLPAVILIPPMILGSGWGDWERSSSVFFKLIDKGFRYYTENIIPLVGADDVARAVEVVIDEKIKPGERFFLVNDNMPQKKFYQIIADKLDRDVAFKKAPLIFMKLLGYVLQFFSNFTGKEPSITPESVKLIATPNQSVFEGSKITQMTSFKYRSIVDIISEIAGEYLKSRNEH